MSGRDPDLDGAYALRTPEDSRRYYRDWAENYDTDFAKATGYRLPSLVCAAFAAAGGQGPILDLGAGTGLLAEALAARGLGPVDGVDISADMLGVAGAKGVYRALYEADLTAALPLPDAAYDGIVSSGTFTHGHVGPEAFDEVLRVARPGARMCFSVNMGVFAEAGFDRKLAALGNRIGEVVLEEEAIYGGAAPEGHAGDSAAILRFCKR
ncbi:MAG: class I SAM-dependent methyltransferase [Paracoccaceae bacterium]